MKFKNGLYKQVKEFSGHLNICIGFIIVDRHHLHRHSIKIEGWSVLKRCLNCSKNAHRKDDILLDI